MVDSVHLPPSEIARNARELAISNDSLATKRVWNAMIRVPMAPHYPVTITHNTQLTDSFVASKDCQPLFVNSTPFL
jgi:hypothetical protein